MNQLPPSQLKSPDSSSQYSRAIQNYEVTHLQLYCWRCLHTQSHCERLTARSHTSSSQPKSSIRATTTQPASHMLPYCDCLTSGKEINGQTASLWLSRVETAHSDMNDTGHAVARATLLSETGPH